MNPYIYRRKSHFLRLNKVINFFYYFTTTARNTAGLSEVFLL